jgi:hypothetical protein
LSFFQVVNPMLSRLITSVSLLAKDPGMARSLLQLATLYLPVEAAAIGAAVLGAWPQVMRPENTADLTVLRRIRHSSSCDWQLQQLLDSKYGAARLAPKPADFFTLGSCSVAGV